MCARARACVESANDPVSMQSAPSKSIVQLITEPSLSNIARSLVIDWIKPGGLYCQHWWFIYTDLLFANYYFPCCSRVINHSWRNYYPCLLDLSSYLIIHNKMCTLHNAICNKGISPLPFSPFFLSLLFCENKSHSLVLIPLSETTLLTVSRATS